MEKQPIQDTRPDWIKTHEVGVGEVEYEGQRIPYTVLNKDLEPNLPGFLGYPDGENLFISEEVPEEYRLPQLIHEIVEFTKLKDKKGRCVEALKHELSFVPGKIWEEYLEYRTDFFARLVEYYKGSKDEDLKEEIRASYGVLQGIK